MHAYHIFYTSSLMNHQLETLHMDFGQVKFASEILEINLVNKRNMQ